MVEQGLSEASQTSSQKVNRAAQMVGDRVVSAGKDLKDKAAEVAGASADAIKEHASGAADAARELGSQAADRFKEEVEDKKEAGARYVGSVADAMRRAAREFDQDLPIAGRFLRNGAERIEMVSDTLRRGDFEELLQDARDFARRQPTAFLGLAVLAGFGAVRFMKSSAETRGADADWASPIPDVRQGD